MLHVHRAERADRLAAALATILADPLDDPLTSEVVCVPTRGMERWLTQRLSNVLGATEGGRDGVCANFAFPSPNELARDAVAAAVGVDGERDPWLPERAVWPLMEVVDASLEEPWLRDLRLHLGDAGDATRRARRFVCVRHIAGLFDRYALHRPLMVRAWARGEREPSPWQAQLWSRLRERLGVPGPAERAGAACARIAERPGCLDLPERLAIFGLTRIPRTHLEVLEAIARHRDVHLFLLHPSAALWDAVARAAPDVVRRRDDFTAATPTNRLLASWARDAREMQLVLSGTPHEDHHHALEGGAASLLERLQRDVRDDVVRAEPEPLDRDDRSVRIHACHGRARQVEVLRDAVVHLLAGDPTLEPRDVIVMCPDVEVYAPLIHAAFGAADVTPAEDDGAQSGHPDLRVRLADRALRQTNPVLGAVAQLLDIAGRRMTASEVLDFADRPPVRRRFGFDDDDLARLREWVDESGVRWGLDARHRAPYKLDDLEAGTWRAGLDRLLLGVTMPEQGHRLFAGVLPVDDVESGVIDLAGRLAELVDRLRHAVDAFAATRRMAEWAEVIGDAADSLTATSQRDAWQRVQLQRVLDGAAEEAAAADDVTLTLPEIRALLAERLAGRPTRANFRTGHLTVCTLVPMRSVPHRVVCLLGLDDGAFPRKAPRDGDDLMLLDPHVGERDPRAEDRQMLLDALMAAQEHLVITYSGNDVRTNARQPPAVPVGELVDVIRRTAGEEALGQVVVRHPLQTFDAVNFVSGRLVAGTPWSFDRSTLAGALAARDQQDRPPEFLPAPLPDLGNAVVELDDVLGFVKHPVRAFLRARLGVSVASYDDDLADGMPLELDNLEQWEVGDRMLAARLAGADRAAAEAAERARGCLPPRRLADDLVTTVGDEIDQILHVVSVTLPADAPPLPLDVRAELAGGRIVSGTVPGVRGDLLATVTYSKMSARLRIVAWAQFLALTAAHPERKIEAVTIARGSTVRLPRMEPTHALEHLEALVALHDRGMREPLPLPCKTSAAYARAVREGDDAGKAARGCWLSDTFKGFFREDHEREHQLVFGGVISWDDLRARPDFDALAQALWNPLLQWERW